MVDQFDKVYEYQWHLCQAAWIPNFDRWVVWTKINIKSQYFRHPDSNLIRKLVPYFTSDTQIPQPSYAFSILQYSFSRRKPFLLFQAKSHPRTIHKHKHNSKSISIRLVVCCLCLSIFSFHLIYANNKRPLAIISRNMVPSSYSYSYTPACWTGRMGTPLKSNNISCWPIISNFAKYNTNTMHARSGCRNCF